MNFVRFATDLQDSYQTRKAATKTAPKGPDPMRLHFFRQKDCDCPTP